MTVELWALAGLTVLAGALCAWAGFTGRPGQVSGVHRVDGETRPLQWHWIDDDQVQQLREPSRRWYDENPWPGDGPHGWGDLR